VVHAWRILSLVYEYALLPGTVGVFIWALYRDGKRYKDPPDYPERVSKVIRLKHSFPNRVQDPL
jgi:hypothetical protein